MRSKVGVANANCQETRGGGRGVKRTESDREIHTLYILYDHHVSSRRPVFPLTSSSSSLSHRVGQATTRGSRTPAAFSAVRAAAPSTPSFSHRRRVRTRFRRIRALATRNLSSWWRQQATRCRRRRHGMMTTATRAQRPVFRSRHLFRRRRACLVVV
jgi:hypothetical protein